MALTNSPTTMSWSKRAFFVVAMMLAASVPGVAEDKVWSAVIVMREIEGMEYQEIADALGCSIGTVMSRLFYARKKLQTLLRDVYEQL